MSSTWLLLDTAHGLEGGLPVESILDNIQFYGDVKAGDKELGGSGGLNGIRWGQKSFTEYVQSEDAKRLLWVPDFGDGLPAWKCDGIDNFWQTETTVTESTFVEWFLFRNADTAVLSMLAESGPNVGTFDGRAVVLRGNDNDKVVVNVQRDATLSSRNEESVTSAFDGSWVLLRREFVSPGSNSDNISFLNNVAMTLTGGSGTPGTGTEAEINYLGMRAGLTFPFNGHYRVNLFASPFPPTDQIAVVEAQINLEYGVY